MSVRPHFPIGALAIVGACLLILASVAVACAPQSQSTQLAAAGTAPISSAISSPESTPSEQTPVEQEPSPDSTATLADLGRYVPWQQIRQLVPWQRFSQGTQVLGFKKYPNIYLGGEDTGHNSMVLYLGPGDDTSFLGDLQAFLDAPIMKATGITPKISIVRCPTSPAGFAAALKAYNAAIPRLKSQGFTPATSEPNLRTGRYDVALSAAPKGMTAAEATAHLRKYVSPLIRVTTVHAPKVQFFG